MNIQALIISVIGGQDHLESGLSRTSKFPWCKDVLGMVFDFENS